MGVSTAACSLESGWVKCSAPAGVLGRGVIIHFIIADIPDHSGQNVIIPLLLFRVVSDKYLSNKSTSISDVEVPSDSAMSLDFDSIENSWELSS